MSRLYAFRMPVLCLLTVLAAQAFDSAPLCGQEPAEAAVASPAWRWRFEPGQKFAVVARQVQSSNTQVDSRETVIEADTTLEMEWQVQNVRPDGTAEMRQRITRIAARIGNPAIPQQEVALDTAGGEPESKTSRDLLKQLRPLLELPMEVVMEPSGKINSVTLPEESESRLQELPGALSIRRLLSPQGLEQLLSQLALPLPEAPPESGSWQTTQSRETPFGPLQQVRTYTPQPPRDGLTEIQIRTTLTPQEGAPAGPKRLISMSEQGQLTFDATRGFCGGGELTSQITTERDYREKTIQTRIDNRVTLRITPQT